MRRTVRLALGAATILAASTALAQTPAGSEYFPLKANSRWVYKVNEATIEVKVSGSDKDGFKLDTVVNGKPVASEVVDVKADGVYRSKINQTAIEPPVKILALKDGKPEKKDFAWPVDSKIQQQAVKGKFTIKEDKVKVPAAPDGVDAVVVDGPDFEIAGAKTAVKYWFAPNKGVVKLSYSIGGNDAVLELKEYVEGK
jgi:hypothetical protein